jgi:hypothetical protein
MILLGRIAPDTDLRLIVTDYLPALMEPLFTMKQSLRVRACGDPTNVVHHRRPGCDQEKWLITLCPACHATVERLERLDRYLPPLLLALWREQHPDTREQLALELAASWEATTGDLPATGPREPS